MIARRMRFGWTAAFLLLVFGAGYFVPFAVRSPFYQGLANDGLILGVLALAASFLMHQCSLVMFGIAVFYGGPAYLFAIASNRWEWGPDAAALFALIGTTIAAAAIGAIVVRAKPLAFAMLTLAIGQMLRQLVLLPDLRPITGGEDGLTVSLDSPFLGFSQSDLSTPSTFWPVAWTASCAIVLVVWLVVHSHLGRVLRATRDNEERMRFSGYNTYLPRLAAFTIAGFVAAAGGVLHMLSSGFASPELLDFSLAGNILVSGLVGGGAGVIGPIFGGLVFTLGLDQFAAQGHLQLFTGIAVVLIITALPQGAEGFLRSAVQRLCNRQGPQSGEGDGLADH